VEGVVVNAGRPDPAFWAGRRVLVTGHTGFKGTWLCWWLHRLGAMVHGFSDVVPTTPAAFDVLGTASVLAHDLRGDVRDAQQVAEAVRTCRPDVIFHLAAQPLVRRSYLDPVETWATNVMGTLHVMEAARRHPDLQALVLVTSDKCYENREWVWGYREDEPMGGSDPYSSSKGAAEIAIRAWRRSYFTPGRATASSLAGMASVRAGNVLGGGDWSEDRIVPDAIRAWTRGAPLEVRSPAAIRPWQHVLDPLRGYLAAAQALVEAPGSLPEALNFGPRAEDALPVRALMDAFAAAWGDDCPGWHVPADAPPQPHEAHFLKLDSSLAAAALGWHPVLPVQKTLESTAAWYRAWHEGASLQALRALTLHQIEALAS
jgi:CDP-glucose 4,6-dehydratase